MNVGLALRPDDTIILPLEYEYYILDTPYNDWYVNHIMAVNPDFYWGLDWHEKSRFFIAVPPVRPESIPEEIYSIRNIDQHGDAILAGSSFISHPYAINRTAVARCTRGNL